MAVSKDEILDAIGKMSVIDVVELIADMEKKFGVTAAAPVAMAAGPAAGAAAATAPGAAAAATGAAAVTPNFFSMSEISSTTSSTVILEMESRISSLDTAMWGLQIRFQEQ